MLHSAAYSTFHVCKSGCQGRVCVAQHPVFHALPFLVALGIYLQVDTTENNQEEIGEILVVTRMNLNQNVLYAPLSNWT